MRRGQLHPVWPRKPEVSSGFTLFGWFTSKTPQDMYSATFDNLIADTASVSWGQ